jgi:hypothetical protein
MMNGLRRTIRFQKALRMAERGATAAERATAEATASRLMAEYKIDPVALCNGSLYDRESFADNALLKKLREEFRATDPRQLHLAKRRQRYREKRDALAKAEFERMQAFYKEHGPLFELNLPGWALEE